MNSTLNSKRIEATLNDLNVGFVDKNARNNEFANRINTALQNSGQKPILEQNITQAATTTIADLKGSSFKQVVDTLKDKTLGHDAKAIEVGKTLKNAIFLKDNSKIESIIKTNLSKNKDPQFVDYLSRKGLDENSPAKAIIVNLSNYAKDLNYYERAESKGNEYSNSITQEKQADKDVSDKIESFMEEIEDKHYYTNEISPRFVNTQAPAAQSINSTENNTPAMPIVNEPSNLEEEKILKQEYLLAQLGQSYKNDGKNYYHKDQRNTHAFADYGEALKSNSNDHKTAEGMALLAEAKGWQSINVSGHNEFKREVWLAASTRGIEVTGYKPNEKDIMELNGRMANKTNGSIEKPIEKDIPVLENKLEKYEKIYSELKHTIREQGYPKGAMNDETALMIIASSYSNDKMKNGNERQDFMNYMSEKTQIPVATKDELTKEQNSFTQTLETALGR